AKIKEIKPPFPIFVRLVCKKNSPPFIDVLDHAGGMDSKKLQEALKYGTQTSMGEDLEAITSAEKGIGLKDAMMALEDNWLITIKDGLVNERKKHLDFKTGIGKEDEKVSQKEREELAIPVNGTIVKGRLPEYFRDRKFITICERLKNHFLLRKLLQDPDYKIYILDIKQKEKRLLEYTPPKIQKQMLKEPFKINYGGNDYPIHLIINRSKEELIQGKPYGESGLLFFYGKYSVADFSLCRFDRDPSFCNFFGEVKMEIEKLIRDFDEVLIDEKRRGLDPEHPFNRQLFNEINKRLEAIQEKEGKSEYSVDEKTKNEILKELNRIYKEIKGVKPPTPTKPPVEPETFVFYPVYVSLKEYEPKTTFLIINSSIITDTLKISLSSTNPDIIVKNPIIQIDKDTVENEFIVKQIELYSEKAKIRGEVIATSNIPSHSEKLGVEVLENPIFSPSNGFAFVPEKTNIIDGGEKKVQLCIDKNVIGNSKEITFSSQSPINCAGKWILPNIENLSKYMIKNIIKLEIPIKVIGTGHIGEEAIITASYEDKATKLDVTVVSEPSIHGLIRDIVFSKKNTKRISDFIEDKGIVEIYYKHPLFKKYTTKKDFRAKSDFLVFVADTITRQILRAFVLTGFKENSSRFSIFDIDHPEPEIEEHVIREYYEQGHIMHEMFIKLAKTFKVGD
ncbi:MAG: ATP-binding protein, partial [Nanoarchaeota archaeon]|nr:ATP-binding protein [Nanoarchaeota archaeon]